jgi:23S rRNA-/tRNA-specific pseudouridylate synthase
MAELKPFTIIYEDDSIIAVNKASGIAVGGERWDADAPRLDLLLKQELNSHKGKKPTAELYTVHRIDKDTSGLVVFAKTAESHRNLSLAFEKRQAEKIYIAVIHGRPSWPGGKTSCSLPLLPDGNKKHLTIVDNYRGKASRTGFT